MRTFIIFLSLFAALPLITGCSDEQKTASSAAEKALELPDKARVVSDLAKIRAAVNMYNAQNGSYPDDLESLKLQTECPLEDYTYDSSDGTVKNIYFSQL